MRRTVYFQRIQQNFELQRNSHLSPTANLQLLVPLRHPSFTSIKYLVNLKQIQ